MRIIFRLRRDMHASLVRDLERPHTVAFERVGWIFAKQARAGVDETLLLAHDYEGVADDNYLPDRGVGARFNTAAIRAALQYSRSTGFSCFQVHLHDHSGRTGFSSVDTRTIDELVPSFRHVAPNVAHGGVVLSRDSATARVWRANAKKPDGCRVVIVGFPMHFVSGD